MLAQFPHVVRYTPASPLSVDEIAQNLIAQHRLLLRVAPTLQNIFPGLEVSKIDIELRAIETSSLREDFWLSLILTYQKDVERSVIEFVEEVFGRDVPEPYEWIVTLLALLVTLSTAQYVYRRVFPNKEPDALKHDYRTILTSSPQASGWLTRAAGRAMVNEGRT